MAVTDSAPFEALPDLTLAEAGDRWGVSSRNSVKARAAALGVELRRESSTRTVWPAEYVALGDRLAEHLKNGGTLASFGPSLTAPTGGSDGIRRRSRWGTFKERGEPENGRGGRSQTPSRLTPICLAGGRGGQRKSPLMRPVAAQKRHVLGRFWHEIPTTMPFAAPKRGGLAACTQ